MIYGLLVFVVCTKRDEVLVGIWLTSGGAWLPWSCGGCVVSMLIGMGVVLVRVCCAGLLRGVGVHDWSVVEVGVGFGGGVGVCQPHTWVSKSR